MVGLPIAIACSTSCGTERDGGAATTTTASTPAMMLARSDSLGVAPITS
jgi:hypothetical protein